MMPATGDTSRPADSRLERESRLSERDAPHAQKAYTLDRITLSGIYDDYHQPLYSYIYRRVGDVETARDLTADVFRRLLQATANGKGPDENVRAWLYRVAHNIVIDFYRRQRHRKNDPLEERLISGDGDPGQAVEVSLQSAQVRAALRQLSPDQQQVIALKFLEGLSNDEVADVINKSVGAVKALQHRGLATLRRRLVSFEEQIPT